MLKFSIVLLAAASVVSSSPRPVEVPELALVHRQLHRRGFHDTNRNDPSHSLHHHTDQTNQNLTYPQGQIYTCGPVEQFYNPTAKDYNASHTNGYLRQWMTKNHAQIARYNGTGGFATAFASYALGNPEITCKIDGSTDCNFDPCNNPKLNALKNNTRNAFYVLQSMKNLHSYFVGLREAFDMSVLLGGLSSDDWTSTFYCSPDGHQADDHGDRGTVALKETANLVSGLFGVAVVIFFPELIPLIVIQQLWGIGTGAFNIGIATANNDSSLAHAIDVAKMIGTVAQHSFETTINTNNLLMSGASVDANGTNIADYIEGGGFLNASVNEVDLMHSFNAMLQGMAINKLWRLNKVFILGGGACGDNQGIGFGPHNASWCDPATNTAWYLYFWQANDIWYSITEHQWGWVAPPPGLDALGQGTYRNITVENVIQSSLAAYQQAEYAYTAEVSNRRMADVVTSRTANPMAHGASWEGIFDIPVCNVSSAITSNYQNKNLILMDYGHDSRPNWCGPICDGDLEKTRRFINAAHMEGFTSPSHYCDEDPRYAHPANWEPPPPPPPPVYPG